MYEGTNSSQNTQQYDENTYLLHIEPLESNLTEMEWLSDT